MLIYKKRRTQHPYTIWLTASERQKLIDEAEGVDAAFTPEWARFIERLKKPREV